MVLLTSLIAYARGIKLFLCGLGASRKTFSAGTLAHAHDDLLQWLCNTAKINKFFLKEKLEVFIMNEVKLNLYVISTDGNDVFGVYDSLYSATKDLFLYLKNEADKHYSNEMQIDTQIFDKITHLYGFLNNDITFEKMEHFLEIYNTIAPNVCSVEMIEVEQPEMVEAIDYIEKYGVKKYKDDFKNIRIKLIEDEINSVISTFKVSEIREMLKYLLSNEIKKMQNDYDSLEVLYYKCDYINELGKLQSNIEDNIDPVIVLKRFITTYNNEYEHTGTYYEMIE
ncbi:TPA: hypothetical protein KMV53_002695 [Staphylococcus aureus]|nr:hypothetical protein [Staphylococcus aureus]